MGKKRIRRTWTDDEKKMICRQARLPGVSTAQVARRYLMNANLLFKWLRDPAYQTDNSDPDQDLFLPVEVLHNPLPELPASVESQAPAPVAEPGGRNRDVPSGRMEITTPSGFRVTVNGDFDSEAVGRLLKALAS